MITFDHFSYTYPSGHEALRNVTLTIPDSAFVVVAGVSGAGKSTLLRAINGLVPQFYGGRCSGAVSVEGRNTLVTPPRALTQSVGFVFQDPEAQFVVPTVEDEIAFGMENRGIAPARMRQKIAEVLDLLGIPHLRRRKVATLSGGEAQRVTIAGALTLEPRCLILDEPTSQLDPPAAHALLDALVDLNCHQRLTIILAEHRLERVLRHATHLLYMERGAVRFGPPRDILLTTPLRPPVVEAALSLGWQPVPLDVAEARRYLALKNGRIADQREAILASIPASISTSVDGTGGADSAVEIRDLEVRYGSTSALQGLNWSIQRGEIVGLLGVNGAGKTTLLKAMVGLVRATRGVIRLLGVQAANRKPGELARIVGYVPQNPNSVFFAETLRDELRFTLRNHALPGDGLELLKRLELETHVERYPRDLSGGERQRAALAAMLAAEPPIVLLDEPTRGLDYVQKRALARLLREWAEQGRTIIVATHDAEWIAGSASRITILERGRIVKDGPAAEVLLQTPGFNTQLGELFNDPRLMTPEMLRASVQSAERPLLSNSRSASTIM